MGLDILSLVMRIEKHFGITIDEDDYGWLGTVGKMAAYIHSRQQTDESRHAEIVLATFLKLRRIVREVVGNRNLRPRPDNKLAEIMTAREQRRFLRRLQENGEVEIYEPIVELGAIVLGSMFILFLLTLCFGVTPLLIAILLGGLGWVVHFFRRDHFPRGWKTLRQITRNFTGQMVVQMPVPQARQIQIVDELRELIVDEFGVRPQDVVPEARFIEDLGLC